MRITAEVIDAILAVKPKKANLSDAQWIAGELAVIDETDRNIQRLAKEDSEARDEYDAKIEDHERIRKGVRKKCRHYVTTYNGDPAGGNDSYRSCDICGVTV